MAVIFSCSFYFLSVSGTKNPWGLKTGRNISDTPSSIQSQLAPVGTPTGRSSVRNGHCSKMCGIYSSIDFESWKRQRESIWQRLIKILPYWLQLRMINSEMLQSKDIKGKLETYPTKFNYSFLWKVIHRGFVRNGNTFHRLYSAPRGYPWIFYSCGCYWFSLK